MLFTQIPGTEDIKNHFIKAISTDQIAHAQMFAGKEGFAHLAGALAYATFVNCEDRQADGPCGKCASCTKMNKLIHPDLHLVFPLFGLTGTNKEEQRNQYLVQFREFLLENPYAGLSEWASKVDAGNKQFSITVDEARSVIKNVSMKPFEGKYKIILVWMPELMNIAAANSMLKVLEEPTGKTLFLLVTNDIEKNIATIISRTQIVNFNAFTDEETIQFLQEKYNVEVTKAEKIAYLAEGSLNKAIQLISDVEDEVLAQFRDWMRLCYMQNFGELVMLSEKYQKFSKDQQKNLFLFGINILREVMLCHTGCEDMIRLKDKDKEFVIGFTKAMPVNTIEPFLRQFETALYHIERNANPRIVFLDLSIILAGILREARKPV